MYTRGEEIANAATHGAGFVFAIAATVLLVVRAAVVSDPWRIATFAVFGASMIVLYAASTLYHVRRSEDAKRLLKKFDHISIFYLIAGTYTPVTLVAMRNDWGLVIFAVVWFLAAAGTVFKVFFTGRFGAVSTAIYVAMGWIVALAIVPLARSVDRRTLVWIIAGGVTYTSGVLFYVWKRLPYGHALWHVFVLGGSACHTVAVASL